MRKFEIAFARSTNKLDLVCLLLGFNLGPL